MSADPRTYFVWFGTITQISIKVYNKDEIIKNRRVHVNITFLIKCLLITIAI